MLPFDAVTHSPVHCIKEKFRTPQRLARHRNPPNDRGATNKPATKQKKAEAEASAFAQTFSVYRLVVVFQPQVGDQLLALDVAQSVLHLDHLDEQIVLGV